MTVDNQLCLHCGTCVGSCPANSLFLYETARIEIMDTCTECELCAFVCPVGAIRRISESASGSAYTPAEEARA